jgi:hypothetical protein
VKLQFLAENNLMDYSLLIGVHHVTDEEKALPANSNGAAAEETDGAKDKKKSKKKSKKSKKNDKGFEVLDVARFGRVLSFADTLREQGTDSLHLAVI